MLFPPTERPAGPARARVLPGQPIGQAAPGPRAGAGRHAARPPGLQAGATEIVPLRFGFQQKFRYIFNLEDKC